jgi:hypothetical protein
MNAVQLPLPELALNLFALNETFEGLTNCRVELFPVALTHPLVYFLNHKV